MAAVRSDRGATLPEVLIGAALMASLVLVGARLVERSVTVMARVGREARGPSLELLRAQLRRDTQEALGIASGAIGWSPGALILVHNGGRTVEVGLDGDELRRRVRDGSGATVSDRVLAGGVTGWWWRPVPSRILDLKVTVLVHEGGSPSPGTMPPWRRTEVMRYALRTPPGGSSW